MVSELGTDMRRVPTANHGTAWAEVARGHDDHAGKRASGQTRQGSQPLMASLVWRGVRGHQRASSATPRTPATIWTIATTGSTVPVGRCGMT